MDGTKKADLLFLCADMQLVEFLDSVLGTDVAPAAAAPSTDHQKVTISTMHGAKGTEFGCVFIGTLTDSILPNSNSKNLNEEW